MKKSFFSLLLLSSAKLALCTQFTIVNSGSTFSPDTITIQFGDTVNFSLASIHNAREVSQSTWAANGSTALSGGFETAFGGGEVLPAQLTVGTHYYVCQPHASMGMKGVIIVETAVNTNEVSQLNNISVFPNPSSNMLSVKLNPNITESNFNIIDELGKIVMSGKLNNNLSSINIQNLVTGFYWVEILVSNESKQTFKIIKK